MASYIKAKEDKSGDTRAEGWVDVEITDVNYVFNVHICTKVDGRLETGHGSSTFVMFGEGDKVISSLSAGEYASTDIFHTTDRDCNYQSRQYRKAYYDANVVSEMLVVNARQVSNTPSNPGEVINWLKDVGGEELLRLRTEALKEGKGAIREGVNFIIRVLK